MNTSQLNIDIKEEQKKAKDIIDKQGLRVLVCAGTGCVANGSLKVIEKFKELGADVSVLTDYDKMTIVPTGCHGFCEQGVLVVIPDKHITYVKVKEKDVEEIYESHIKNNKPVERLLYVDPKTHEHVLDDAHINFYAKQTRTALANCGNINAECIDEAIAVRGYEALANVLIENNPDAVIDTIENSGLRGRGGGGFPTGRKWRFTAANKGGKSYIVCNGDEGDPGAFMDRSVMEGDPHKLLEGMAIAAFAIGADEGYIYVRAEYPLAIKRLRKAIKDAEERNFLGKNIMGSNFSLDIHIKEGAGAFVCGEETALIASLEGERGMPRLKPPFPAQKGYWQKPTNINNVETYANVAWKMLNGGDTFGSMGTKTSNGTKVFALAGKIKKGGLVEVPMGISLREVIYDIGGGIKEDKEFKAVQMGGPSGGCIPASLIDTPVDYENINKTGAIVGSGGMIVMDETTCMVDMARYFLDFTRKESCGKCNYCRIGTKRMLEILERITNGEGKDGDIELLEELAYKVKDGAMCGLGQTAPNPVITTLKYFRHEYEDHIYNKKCTAKACKSLISYDIVEDKCKGCGACKKKCPVSAISGNKKEAHVIDKNICIKCGKCMETCKFDAIEIN